MMGALSAKLFEVARKESRWRMPRLLDVGGFGSYGADEVSVRHILGSGEQLIHRARGGGLCRDTFKEFLKFENPEAFENLEPQLKNIFEQFYGAPDFRYYPGLIWVCPYKLAPEALAQRPGRGLTVKLREPTEELSWEDLGSKFTIGFGEGEPSNVNVDLQGLFLTHPGRGMPTRPIKVKRMLSFTDDNGSTFHALSEEVGLVSPDSSDQECIERGVLPDYESRIELDRMMGASFYNLRQIVFSRLRPSLLGPDTAELQEIQLVCDPVSGHTVTITAACAEFNSVYAYQPQEVEMAIWDVATGR